MLEVPGDVPTKSQYLPVPPAVQLNVITDELSVAPGTGLSICARPEGGVPIGLGVSLGVGAGLGSGVPGKTIFWIHGNLLEMRTAQKAVGADSAPRDNLCRRIVETASVEQRGIKNGTTRCCRKRSVDSKVNPSQFPNARIVYKNGAARVAGRNVCLVRPGVSIEGGTERVTVCDADFIFAPTLRLVAGTPFPSAQNTAKINRIAALCAATDDHDILPLLVIPRIERCIVRHGFRDFEDSQVTHRVIK